MFSERCLVVCVQCSVFLSQSGGIDALKNGSAVPLLVQAHPQRRFRNCGGVWRVACGVWRVAVGWRVACGVCRVACDV